MREVLRRIRRKYHLGVPSKVVMADYDDKEGDLYIKFNESELTEGEPSSDGLLIVHRDRKNEIAALEILSLHEL